MSIPARSRAGTPRTSNWWPSPRALLAAAIAFAAGLLLFLLSWMNDRSDGFYRAPAPVADVAGRQFEPLPAPAPANDAANASGMGTPAERQAAAPRIQAPQPAPPAPALPQAPPTPVATAPDDAPVAIHSPAPRYPPEALRRGESGSVLLRVHVDAGGMPQAIDLVRSSRSRALDRAATVAVWRWRFRPAQRDGRPVDGAVQVPIVFTADR